MLEIGTGSGYQTVLLAHLAAQVFSVERIKPLLDNAREAIKFCEVSNVSLMLGDGTYGWKEYAPYDAILVGAASPDVPQPLIDQLAEGGRLLVPVGSKEEQQLLMITRKGDTLQDARLSTAVRFVPLVGDHGCESPPDRAAEGAGRRIPRISCAITRVRSGCSGWTRNLPGRFRRTRGRGDATGRWPRSSGRSAPVPSRRRSSMYWRGRASLTGRSPIRSPSCAEGLP